MRRAVSCRLESRYRFGCEPPLPDSGGDPYLFRFAPADRTAQLEQRRIELELQQCRTRGGRTQQRGATTIDNQQTLSYFRQRLRDHGTTDAGADHDDICPGRATQAATEDLSPSRKSLSCVMPTVHLWPTGCSCLRFRASSLENPKRAIVEARREFSENKTP